MKPDERNDVRFWRAKVRKWAKTLGIQLDFEVHLVNRPEADWMARTSSSFSHPAALIEINTHFVTDRKFRGTDDDLHYPVRSADELVLHELVHMAVNRYKSAVGECVRGLVGRLVKDKEQGQLEYNWFLETTNLEEEEMVDILACNIYAAYKAGLKEGSK